MSGGGHPNTAWGAVIHHEYGHHLVASAGSGQGEYGEGMSDSVDMVMNDDPGLGYGFFGPCDEPLRTAEAGLQYPCSGGIHYCGQVLSGCIWDTRNELVITEPVTYRDIIANLTINSILLHSGSSITPQITIDFLTLDDDDDDIFNGTPHYNEINTGFSAHNMPGPQLDPISFEYPNGRPAIIDPDQTATFQVNVLSVLEDPVPDTGELHYSIDDGAVQTVSMDYLGSDQYEAVLPAAECESLITWWVSAEADGSGVVTDPRDAPDSTYATVVATDIIIAFEDDFNTDQNWSVQNNCSDGQWERGIPAGGGDRGDPPTDADCSGYCYVTDNADGNSDVDDGSTTLISPVMDAPGGNTMGPAGMARW
jgi:hypothetical protein